MYTDQRVAPRTTAVQPHTVQVRVFGAQRVMESLGVV